MSLKYFMYSAKFLILFLFSNNNNSNNYYFCCCFITVWRYKSQDVGHIVQPYTQTQQTWIFFNSILNHNFYQKN